MMAWLPMDAVATSQETKNWIGDPNNNNNNNKNEPITMKKISIQRIMPSANGIQKTIGLAPALGCVP
jgi:hypothetical protein